MHGLFRPAYGASLCLCPLPLPLAGCYPPPPSCLLAREAGTACPPCCLPFGSRPACRPRLHTLGMGLGHWGGFGAALMGPRPSGTHTLPARTPSAQALGADVSPDASAAATPPRLADGLAMRMCGHVAAPASVQSVSGPTPRRVVTPPVPADGSVPAGHGRDRLDSEPQGLRLLHWFSGPQARPDGLLAHCRRRGGDGWEVDSGYGDADAEDLTVASVVERWDTACARREVDHMHAGVPCFTHTVILRRPLRPRDEPEGGHTLLVGKSPPHLTAEEVGKLELVNTLIRHTACVCTTLHFAGGTFSIEAPGDRGNVELSFYWDRFADRASLAQHPDILALIAITGAVWIYAPQCAFGSPSQKWTIFLVSACLVPYYVPIVSASCTCTSHEEVAYGHDAAGNSLARKAAAYPGPLNVALVDGPWEWHYGEVPDEEVAGGEIR